MKLLQYTKCLKELELNLEADNILNTRLISEMSKTQELNIHLEHAIPIEEITKLDKFWVLKDLEDEHQSIILEVEELKERWKEVEEKLTFVVIRFL